MCSSFGSGFNAHSSNTLEFLALPRPPGRTHLLPSPPISRWPFAHVAACNGPVFPQQQLVHLVAQSSL